MGTYNMGQIPDNGYLTMYKLDPYANKSGTIASFWCILMARNVQLLVFPYKMPNKAVTSHTSI